MARARLIGRVAGAMVLAVLGLPAVAVAGTYAWNQPGDFTTTAPGSNPEHRYGAASWSYVEGASASALAPLDTFTTGGFPNWHDHADTSALVGANGSNGVLEPTSSHVVALRWTAPLSATVSVTGTIANNMSSCPASADSWSLQHNGMPVSGQGGLIATTPTISSSVAVSGGDTIDLVDAHGGLPVPSCQANYKLSITAPSNPPTVTMTSPADGSTITGVQPTFRGAASTGFGDSSTVTVRVYSNTFALLETLPTTASGGSYSVDPSPPLAGGTYVAQAEQDNAAGDHGLTSGITFIVHNPAPTVTLASVGSAPLLTSTPTLTGTAGTDSGDASDVTLKVFAGSDTSGTPVRTLSGARGSGGSFAIQITPGLDDGRYTAVATQQGPGGTVGSSSPQTFRIKLNPPAITFDRPATGATVRASSLVFSGQAGTALGDSPQVVLVLYQGEDTVGKPVAVLRVRVSGGRWSTGWPGKLTPGLYTALARQSDDAGHTTTTKPHTFVVTASAPVIGPWVSLDRKGFASVAITCPGSLGVCTGNVLVVTTAKLQPVRGGPKGRVRVLFAHVTIPAGRTMLVKRAVPPAVARALRRAPLVWVRVTVSLSQPGGPVINTSAIRLLRVSA